MQNCSTNIGPKPVGAVFTPLRWASFAIDRFGIYDSWMSGKTVFDPTMGEGNLLEALVKEAIARGVRTEEVPVQRLYGVEVEKSFLSRFFEKMKRQYGIDMPKGNFVQADYFFWASRQKFDVVFGNPPWANFADLPETYKGLLKPKFVEYGLAPDKKDLLLGGSRIDISALVVQKTVAEHLKPKGRAVFFLPLSLLLNDGAHKAFRAYSAKGIPFEVKTIFDFNGAAVFEGVSTRYSVVEMVGGREQRFPVPFHRWESGEWVGHMAKPAFLPNDPLSVFKGPKDDSGPAFDPIYLPVNAVPRQGVNTGGANDCFIFDACASNGDGLVEVANKKHRATLPQEFVHPLLVGKNFKNDCRDPQKWVFIPFQKDGKPLSPDRIRENEHLSNYLGKHEQTLKNRKGVMLSSWIKRGYWWAMLGVGPYNFAPFKVVWEAYGKHTFEPKIFDGTWQANQSLQAYIPFSSKEAALEALKKLMDKRVEAYLLSLKMEGTMNWAQPGKIKKIIKFEVFNHSPMR